MRSHIQTIAVQMYHQYIISQRNKYIKATILPMIFLIIACMQAYILLGQFQLTYINILTFY